MVYNRDEAKNCIYLCAGNSAKQPYNIFTFYD